MSDLTMPWQFPDTLRVTDLRRRVREAMKRPGVAWEGCPARIDERWMSEPLPVRKARAVALKLAHMPVDLWEGQLFAGSMTLEEPRTHAERGFPDYVTDEERAEAVRRGLSIRSVFGHIVPDYPKLLRVGLVGIRREANLSGPQDLKGLSPDEIAFLDSVVIALDGVIAFAKRLADHCEQEAAVEALTPIPSPVQPGVAGRGARSAELRQMAANLRQVPAGPAQTFWQALQLVWLLHMVFHSTMDGNALGRLDQYAWPYLQADLQAGRLTLERAAELVDCFCLKFNERAQTNDEQRPDARPAELSGANQRTRHGSSSQIGTRRDQVDATNHWLQNIVIGGLTPDGGANCADGTNLLTALLLDAYRRNRMTNPLLTVRLHKGSPDALVRQVCEVLKEGGGMPAMFNDEMIIPSLEKIGIPTPDARDYTNDGCWEIIIPGRTDFRFQRISVMLPLEWALNRGVTRLTGEREGLDTGDPRQWTSYDDVWRAFVTQLDRVIGQVVKSVAESVDDRSTIAPVPLLSALIDGAIESRRDMTAGGAKYRTYGMLAESAAHAIDSLAAIRNLVFAEERNRVSHRNPVSMAELCDALDADFVGYEPLRAWLAAAPKYGNDDERADSVGRELIQAFTQIVEKHARQYQDVIKFPCGVGTFSWYVGIGEGLGASPDGRRAWEPVSSNFSPALGRDLNGIPGAILSYSKMQNYNLPAGSPLDLRLAKRLVLGDEGTGRMVGLARAFVEIGGAMMTLTVADTEELRAAQREPDKYESLRVRMGGWCAYFTMLSREQQEHHIRRQEGNK